MSHVCAVTPDHPLCGTWSAPSAEDSTDSNRTQYTVMVAEERFVTTGVDPMDGEEFLIYDVGYDGESLRFTSLMPSTSTKARVSMRVVNQNRVECRWTITETEIWVRQPFPFHIIK